MSKMGDLVIEINELLDSSDMLCDEIAAYVGAPLFMVEAIVQTRWLAITGGCTRDMEQLVLDF